MTVSFRTILGFDYCEPDDQRLSTGVGDLDRRLLSWLDLREGERTAYRQDELCVLVDRGYMVYVHGEAAPGGASAYEDSMRKGLQIMIDRDYFEAKTGRLPRDDE